MKNAVTLKEALGAGRRTFLGRLVSFLSGGIVVASVNSFEPLLAKTDKPASKGHTISVKLHTLAVPRTINSVGSHGKR